MVSKYNTFLFISCIYIITAAELGGNTLDDHVSQGNSEKVCPLIFNLKLLLVTL